MSEITCYYHQSIKANTKCLKCKKLICIECDSEGLCPICFYKNYNPTKSIFQFIGITIFFIPFFFGIFMLVSATINAFPSFIFWILFFFALAWCGGVIVGYISVIKGFVEEFKEVRRNKLKKKTFMRNVGYNKDGSIDQPKSPMSTQFFTNTEYNVVNGSEIIEYNKYIFCYRCGQKMKINSNSCLKCGAKFDYSIFTNQFFS